METTGRSTLLGKVGTIVGFAFGPHPVRRGWFVNIVVYDVGDVFVLAMGEGAGKGRPHLMRSQLGESVPGSAFAPYAQRCIAGMSLDELSEVLSGETAGYRWEWLAASSSAPAAVEG